MKELFYYSIFAIVLYFVLTAIFDNFNLEQENFDPSLVPVSSIVTLAKVAQKLMNGGGTLTNPKNLQIGTPGTNTTGNLTVTGNSTVNGNITVSNSRTDTGIVIDTAKPFITFKKPEQPVDKLPQIYSAGNDIHVDNASGGFVVDSGGAKITGNSTVSGTLNVSGGVTVGTTSSAQPIKTWGSVESNSLTVGPGSSQFNGPVTAGATLGVGTNLNVGGTFNVTGTSYLGGGPRGLTIKNGPSPHSHIFQFGDGYGWGIRFQQSDERPILDIKDNQNVKVTGALETTSDIYGSGYVFAGNSNNDTKVRLGEAWGSPGIYLPSTTKDFKIHSLNKNVSIGLSTSYPNNLNVTGNLNITGTLTGNKIFFRS